MFALVVSLVVTLVSVAYSGPVLDDILNHAAVDQSCLQRDKRLEVTQNSPIGQTFVTGPGTQQIFRITVSLDQSPEEWLSGEAVTLALWDSPAKNHRLAEFTLDNITVKNVIGENPFYLGAPAQPNTPYYFEITHNGKGDGKAFIYATSQDCYRRGHLIIGGSAQDGDLYFKVLVKRDVDHDLLMEDLFKQFDLDAPGMEKVKRCVHARDWEGAIRETVAHFDAKPLSQWHASKATPKKNPSAELRAAEKALRHIVEVEGKEFFLGERVNWWADPLPGTPGPSERLCNWGLPRIMGYAYINSGDERYARKADEFYINWMLDNPPPVRSDIDWYGVAYSGLQIARKLGPNAWYFYGELMKSPNFRVDTRMAFIYFQTQFCELLYQGIGTNGEGWGGNWGFQIYDALLENALENPEYAGWRKWADFAMGRLIALSREALCADGVLNEAAPNYHAISARRLRRLLEWSEKKKLGVPADLRETLARMYTFMAYLTQPDGRTPMFGDSDSESYCEELQQVARLLGRADLEYIATQGRKGKPPARASVAFPVSGFYIMRSTYLEQGDESRQREIGGSGLSYQPGTNVQSARRFEDALYLAVHNGNWVGTHGHFDLTAPVVYGYGRPLLVDPGRYEYSKEHDWFWVAKAHNVVIMDDRNYENYNHTTEYSYWASTDLIDYFDGRNHFYKDVTSDREIIFVKPDYWMVMDQVYADGEHKFAQYWHFTPGKIEIDDHWKIASTQFPTGGNLCVIPVIREGLECRKEDGYVAFKAGVREQAPVVVYEKGAAGSVCFATLLYPWKVEYGKPALSVRSLIATRTPGVYAFSVSTFRGTDYVAVCRRRDAEIRSVESSDFSATARAAVIRTDVRGRLNSVSWIEGLQVTLHDRILARAARRIGWLDVRYEEKTLFVYCREEEPTLEIWSGECSNLVVNGKKRGGIISGTMIKPFAGFAECIIVDDSDARCTRMPSLEWIPMPDGNPIGISYFAHETDVGRHEWAEWKVALPITGEYAIEVYIPCSIFPLSRETKYTVNGHTVSVDQGANAGRWVSLGTYSLRGGETIVKVVNLSKEDGRYLVVDGVRLRKLR